MGSCAPLPYFCNEASRYAGLIRPHIAGNPASESERSFADSRGTSPSGIGHDPDDRIIHASEFAVRVVVVGALVYKIGGFGEYIESVRAAGWFKVARVLPRST